MKGLSSELVERVKVELKKIKEDGYMISDVSDDMKQLVRQLYGSDADNLSTSGYWVRAEGIILGTTAANNITAMRERLCD
jgi:hypothetical protein